ncbi:TetR/AcrR family transcriptional regulator [Cereibacter sphaeroides]|nr:TetR/AcrR family transcriptional regulator [Cereibacter sphaeroides]
MDAPLFDPDKPRDRLLAAAARLFHQKGYAATTVREIGAEVGILSGSLFHHVRSKEEMLFAVMERVIAAMQQDLTRALDEAPDLTGRLRALIAVELSYLHGPASDATAVLFHDWRALSEARRAVLLDGRQAYFTLWHQVLTEAHSAGLIAVEPGLMRQFLHGALAWTSFWYRPDGSLDLQTMTDQALTLTLGHAI